MVDPFLDWNLNLPEDLFLEGFGIDFDEGEIEEDGFLEATCLVFILEKKLEGGRTVRVSD